MEMRDVRCKRVADRSVFLAAIFFFTPAIMAETVSGGRDLTHTSRLPLHHTPDYPLPRPGNSSAVTQSLAEWPDKPQLQQTPCTISAATERSLSEGAGVKNLGFETYDSLSS